VLRKRQYLTPELCSHALLDPIRSKVQEDGRIRHWSRVTLSGEAEERILRVVTLEDGETIHKAFLDRGFREDGQ
jgi:hypothetical protein